MVVVDVDKFPRPMQVSCGEQVSLYTDVYNIGDEDFLDQIMVSLYNSELGIDLEEVSMGDLDSGERTEVVFSFDIPFDAEEKQHKLKMRIDYDYDEDDEVYEYESKEYLVALKTSGNCVRESSALITANLVSEEIMAGEELVVKSTITNDGDETITYSVDVVGYSTWASSVKLDPQTFTLGAGDSKDVLVTFEIKEDVSGEKTFDIVVVGEGEDAFTRAVSVPIEEPTGISLPSLLEDQNYLWGIIALNIILVVVIIIVAVRIMKRK
jgi:uncharacterized membrane protein